MKKFKDNLSIYNCLSCEKHYKMKFNEKWKEKFENLFKFCKWKLRQVCVVASYSFVPNCSGGRLNCKFLGKKPSSSFNYHKRMT